MRKILFHVASLQLGGAERQLTYLVKGIAAVGWEPHVVTLYRGGQFWDELSAFGGCRLVSLDRKGKADFSVIRKLAHYAREQKIDLLQGWMPPANTFAAMAALLSGGAYLMGVRASNMDYPSLGGKLYLRTDRFFASRAAKIIYNSEDGRSFHVGFGYPDSSSVVIPNGVNVPAGMTFPSPFSLGPPWRIGMLARLDPMKDHPTMFRALRILLDQRSDVELHLFGDGSPDYVSSLHGQAIALGIEPHLHWHGRASDSWKALAGVDILVSSSYGEGMSNAVLEGMSAGRVVIVTAVGGASLLINSENVPRGFIVPVRDSAALADAIAMALADKDASLTMARRGEMFVRESLSVSAMVNAYRNLYENLTPLLSSSRERQDL